MTLEIQYHPADIASAPRYWFLRPAVVRRLVAGVALLATVLLAGLALAPRGISALLLWGRIARLQDEIAEERQSLATAATELEALGGRFDQARVLGERLALVFGAETAGTYAGGATAVLLEGDPTSDPGVALLKARALSLDSELLLERTERLAGVVADQRELAAVVPSTCPLAGGSFVLTSPYGSRISPFTGRPDFHSGIDLAARKGDTVHAAGDGIVTFAGRFPLSRNPALWRLGNVVVINHGDRYLTIYAHLNGISVRSGASVVRGARVGTVGNTGWSTSPHLHYEVRQLQPSTREQTPLDPRIFILDHDWSEQEAWLVASRTAPAPAVEPLPIIAKGR